METIDENETVRKKNKSHARLKNYSYNLRRIFSNRMVLIGVSITLFFFVIDLLDWLWPQYLGITSGLSLDNIMTAFHRESGVTYNGRPFVVGALISLAPYGTPGAYITIVPPTLTGPTGTPSWWWWLGGTSFSVPLLPIVLASLKYDITYSLIIVVSGALVGTFAGALAGYYGGIADEIIMRITDVFFSLPYIIFALAIVYALGPDLLNVIIALVIIWWPNYARLARAQAMKIRASSYMEAAIASGSSGLRNIISHIIPNSFNSIFVQATLDLGVILQVFVTLGFLGSKNGFGLYFQFEPAFYPELGNIMSWGVQYVFSYPLNWWPIVIPGAFIILFALGASLLGDGIRDIYDPKLNK